MNVVEMAQNSIVYCRRGQRDPAGVFGAPK